MIRPELQPYFLGAIVLMIAVFVVWILVGE